jgi:hypothetical protein
LLIKIYLFIPKKNNLKNFQNKKVNESISPLHKKNKKSSKYNLFLNIKEE